MTYIKNFKKKIALEKLKPTRINFSNIRLFLFYDAKISLQNQNLLFN